MITDAVEFIDDFMAHAGTYDPAKAHEYYLRNRKLKGRKAGAGDTSGGRPSGTARPPAQPPQSNDAEARRKAAEARVAAIRKRLDRLKEILADLVEQAQKASGVDTTKDDKKAKDKTPDKPKTAAQKRKDAQAAKERRDKESKSTPSKEVAALNKQIEEVQKKIEDARARLKAALQRGRDKTSTPGTSPGSTPGNNPQTASKRR